MKNLCVIPARRGSKRLKNKNKIDFFGKPMISYTIESAIKSKCFEKILVSTDDLEIRKIAESYNEEKLKEYMRWDSITIEVNLKLGSDAFECYTCDFTHDYIDINADYRN